MARFTTPVLLPETTYVTPALSAPRASQMDTVDLSASSGSSTLSGHVIAPKRPPTSPQKPKSPAKRRNLHEVDDSDEDLFRDEDEDVYMTILDDTLDHKRESDKAEAIAQKSPYFRNEEVSNRHPTIPNSSPGRETSPSRLSRHITPSDRIVAQSPVQVVRADTPVRCPVQRTSPRNNSTDADEVTSRRPLTEVLPPPYIATPVSIKKQGRVGSSEPSSSPKLKQDLILSLKAEHMQLKADMTEIVEDEARGPYCVEAKTNKRRREEIQAQLVNMVESRDALQQKLQELQRTMLADVMSGIMPSAEIKLEVQSLTERIKEAENIVIPPSNRPSSVCSVAPASHKLSTSPLRAHRHVITNKLNDHNQLAKDNYDAPRNFAQPPAVGRQLFPIRPAESHSFSDRTVNGQTNKHPHVTDGHLGASRVSNQVKHTSDRAQSHETVQRPNISYGDPQPGDQIIELISDDESEGMNNMGQAVDFDEDDFSDGLDYAQETDLDAQRARYEELSGRYQNQAVFNSANSDNTRLATMQRPKMTTSSRKGPIDDFMRPTQSDPSTKVTSNAGIGVARGTQSTYVSASPTQQQATSWPQATQRIAQTQAAPRVARPTARPVDLMSLPGMNHPWSRDVVNAMNDVFRLRYFRSNQLEAINATLSGRDAFVLMPTGGGKSLCYQLPSIIQSGTTRGVTVVVSPLVSLMQDQVDHLAAINIRATSFSSEKTLSERGDIMKQLFRNELDCIYVAPEMLAKSDAINKIFKQLWERQCLARIVIDEAHCVSQWGHDFRPDYKKLGDFRREYDGVPVIALTATANDKVQVDVKNHLGLKDPACFKQSFNRPNLRYYVYPRSKGSNDKIKDLLDKTHKGQIGIIYCLSRAKCEAMAQQLGRRAGFYHAGMKKDERADIQRLWQAGTVQVIVATIAFGMGIDKPDVRFVIHTSLPKSLEGYYQETGRAGRDGRDANCYLFWAFADKVSLEKMIDRGESEGQQISPAQKKVQKEGIQRVVDYADNKADCRRVQVLGFFNEQYDAKDCHGTCDNCQSGEVYTDQDVSEAAKVAAQIVKAIQVRGDTEKDRRATLNDVVLIARGSRAARITEKGWDQIPGFQGLKSDARWDITNTTKLVQHLSSIGVLSDRHVPNAMGFTTTYCVPGPNADAASSGKIKVSLKIQSPRTAKKPGLLRTESRQSRGPDTDDTDFIVEDDEIGDDEFLEPELSSVSRARLPKNLQQLRHDPSRGPSSVKSTMAPPAAKARREKDSHAVMMSKMYKKSFTPLDLDRIARCWAELKQVRNAIQQKQGHRRLESTFSDQVLQDIAVHLPISPGELLKIPDVKREIVDVHGFQILIVTNKYQEEIDALGIDLDAQLNAVSHPPARPASLPKLGAASNRNTSRRTSAARPNYSEPYFRQEAEDDEENYFGPDEDEQEMMLTTTRESHPFHAPVQQPTIAPAAHGKDKRKSVPGKGIAAKHKSKSDTSQRSEPRSKTSGTTRKTGGSGIGAAKPR